MIAPRNLRACPRCEALVERGASVCPYCGDSLAPAAPRAGTLLARPDLLSRLLLALLASVFVLQLGGSGSEGLAGLTGAEASWMGGVDPAGVFLRHEYWRLISGTFLHAGIWHLLFNAVALWQLGPQVEHYWGRARMLVLYVGTGIVASLASAVYHYGMAAGWLAGIGFGGGGLPATSLGASGAIFGLLGAAAGLSLHQRGLVGAALTHVYRRWIVLGLIFGIVVTRLNYPIDNVAHVAGLAAGLLFGRYVPNLRTRPESARARRTWKGLALLAGLLVLLSLGLALRFALTQPKPRRETGAEARVPDGRSAALDSRLRRR